MPIIVANRDFHGTLCKIKKNFCNNLYNGLINPLTKTFIGVNCIFFDKLLPKMVILLEFFGWD